MSGNIQGGERKLPIYRRPLYRNNVENMKFYTYHLMKAIRKSFINDAIPVIMEKGLIDPTNVQATLNFTPTSKFGDVYPFSYRAEFKIPYGVDRNNFTPKTLNDYSINVYLERPPRPQRNEQ